MDIMLTLDPPELEAAIEALSYEEGAALWSECNALIDRLMAIASRVNWPLQPDDDDDNY
jgi:hypothetical protein